jgi:hypothetical protein
MRILSLPAIALCAMALTGCAPAVAPPDPMPDASSSGRFTGPWAELFEVTYEQATSDDERAALDDSEISAEEYAYFQDRIIGCLDRIGVSGSFASDGSLSYTKPEDASEDAIRDCNAENGIRVIGLRDAILRNPNHLDESEIMLECLQRNDVVGPAYTVADLENGVDIEKLSAESDFAGCAADPLRYSGE